MPRPLPWAKPVNKKSGGFHADISVGARSDYTNESRVLACSLFDSLSSNKREGLEGKGHGGTSVT